MTKANVDLQRHGDVAVIVVDSPPVNTITADARAGIGHFDTMTAGLQARRRLGLTATLVREDGREGDVFSLIGPKRYDAPWKDIEAQGWIAPSRRLRSSSGRPA